MLNSNFYKLYSWRNNGINSTAIIIITTTSDNSQVLLEVTQMKNIPVIHTHTHTGKKKHMEKVIRVLG